MNRDSFNRAAVLFGALAAFCFQGVRAETAKPAAPAPVDFSVACSNAWLKCVTAKDPVAAVGEDITFSLTLEGVTNDIPAGVYSYKWKRTGDDGVTDEGSAPVTKKAFTYTTKGAKAGSVRFTVDMVGKDGKPFLRTNGKARTPLHFAAGALVAPEQLVAEPEAKESAQYFKDLAKRLGHPNFKKVVRTPVALEGQKVASLFRVDLPSPTEHPLKALLSVPAMALAGTNVPCRVTFSACGYGKDVPLPQAKDVSASDLVVTLGYEPGKAEERNEAFCGELYLEVLRTLEYAKSLPEWNGNTLKTDGSGMSGLLALWAASAGEGVTAAVFSNLPTVGAGHLAPELRARYVPAACKVTIPRAGLGDAAYRPDTIVRIWNSLTCDRTVTWCQGSEGWTVPRAFKGRDLQWEKLSPVRYVRMDAEHARVEAGIAMPFADLDLTLTGSVVMEILFDYSRPVSINMQELARLRTYATTALAPFALYAVVPEKKIKEKQWAQFRDTLKKGGSAGIPFPVYVNAGMDLPAPDILPWFHVVDAEGVLRYSGDDIGAAVIAQRAALKRVPPSDPVFAGARPKLLKATTDRLLKSGLSGSKFYKALEAEMKKLARKDPASAEEAKQLLLGMRQAVDRRLMSATATFKDRPGRALCDLQTLLAEWPEAASMPATVALQKNAARKPEVEKLAKLEKELQHLHAWKPMKPADIRKKDAELAAFRKKLERLSKSQDAVSQGEALLMQADLDNPPHDPGS